MQLHLLSQNNTEDAILDNISKLVILGDDKAVELMSEYNDAKEWDEMDMAVCRMESYLKGINYGITN